MRGRGEHVIFSLCAQFIRVWCSKCYWWQPTCTVHTNKNRNHIALLMKRHHYQSAIVSISMDFNECVYVCETNSKLVALNWKTRHWLSAKCVPIWLMTFCLWNCNVVVVVFCCWSDDVGYVLFFALFCVRLVDFGLICICQWNVSVFLCACNKTTILEHFPLKWQTSQRDEDQISCES